MKVFIFGAGASLASQTGKRIDDHLKAPLVNDLFHPNYQVFWSYLGFSANQFQIIRNTLGTNGSVEKWLTDEWAAIDQLKNASTVRSRRKTFGEITFYLWWFLQNVSTTYDEGNYYRFFIDKLLNDDQDFGIINFNYDTLLDRALHQSGASRPLNDISAYIESRYIKPHGSVNWFLKRRHIDPQLTSAEVLKDLAVRYGIACGQMFSQSLQVSDPLVWVPSHSDLNRREIIMNFDGQYLYPLVLLPLTIKLYKHFEGFKEYIIKAGCELIAQATEIYLIGYRAQDDIIKELLEPVKSKTFTRLHVVSLQDAHIIMDRVLEWKPELQRGNVIDSGFVNYINHSFF